MKSLTTKLSILSAVLLMSCSSRVFVTKTDTPAQAIETLIAGNERFIKGKSQFPHIGIERIKETTSHQKPFAAIVGCSDSRVPIELIFDRGIGDLFVVRTAGNSVAEASTEGSVDYAVLHLGVKAIVVLGHQSCGGISGAVSNNHPDKEGKVEALMELIREDIAEYVGLPEKTEEAIQANVVIQVERIKNRPHVKRLIDQGVLVVQGAYYNTHTGKVTFMK